MLDKVHEELQELAHEVKEGNKEKMEDEFGDVLFALINYARFIEVNPENALEKTNRKFMNRFKLMEEMITIDDKNMKDMSRQALDMLHRSIDAYVHLDVRTAREVCDQDESIDNLNRIIIDELTRLMQTCPELVEPALHMFSASRQIERIADHATNIAEDVVYLVQGEIIRHRLRTSTIA